MKKTGRQICPDPAQITGESVTASDEGRQEGRGTHVGRGEIRSGERVLADKHGEPVHPDDDHEEDEPGPGRVRLEGSLVREGVSRDAVCLEGGHEALEGEGEGEG